MSKKSCRICDNIQLLFSFVKEFNNKSSTCFICCCCLLNNDFQTLLETDEFYLKGVCLDIFYKWVFNNIGHFRNLKKRLRATVEF